MLTISRRGFFLATSASLLLADVAHAQQQPLAQTWPRTIASDNGSAAIYQPQVISWPDQKTLNARVAIAITRTGEQQPILGTIDLSLATQTDRITRSVALSDPQVTGTRFPTLDTTQAQQVEARIRAGIAQQLRVTSVPLDTILLSLKDNAAAAQPVVLNNDPPAIFHSSRPASLIVFDGDPVFAPIGATGLTFAVNTNWNVVSDATTKITYLLINGSWYSAAAATGPYKPAGPLPVAFTKIPNDEDFKRLRASVPGKPLKPAEAPTIFVSTKPAEIIVSNGPLAYTAITGTNLEFANNTNSAVFRDKGKGTLYYLVSGRWFSAASLDGPWTFATPNLPMDFTQIPPGSPVGNALASVPGTAQAQEAVLQARIPQEATLKRGSAQPMVVYSGGAPQFKPIPGTSVAYAVNTAAQVLEIAGKYYVVEKGAWFVGNSPTGPWVLADNIPAAVSTIPPSSPVYNVTYVKVYDSTPETVTYGYTAGYMMGFVTAGIIAYGTGYYYPPVVIHGPVPIYYPYHLSYCGGAYYNPATGAWARGGAVWGPYYGAAGGAYYNPNTGAWGRGGYVYGPYGGAAAGSVYNPNTGTYKHGSAVWGPNGGSAYGQFYNPRYGVSGSTQQHWNQYSRWGSSVVNTPNQTIHTASASNSRGSAGAFSSSSGAAGAGVHTASGNTGIIRGPGGNVYAGHDGNVYQHTDNGWQKMVGGSSGNQQQPNRNTATNSNNSQARQNRTAAQAQQPQGRGGQFGANTRQGSPDNNTYNQLERDRGAREGGAQRQRSFQQGGGGGRWGGGGGGGYQGGGHGGFGRR